MLVNPIVVKESQSVVTRLAIKDIELQSKNSSTKVNNELIKKINVDISNLSIILISVPNSFNAFMNFEFENAGMSEKLDRNIAVANAEKDKEADIISVKLFIFEGLILNMQPTKIVVIPTIRTTLFRFIRPFFILYFLTFNAGYFKLSLNIIIMRVKCLV